MKNREFNLGEEIDVFTQEFDKREALVFVSQFLSSLDNGIKVQNWSKDESGLEPSASFDSASTKKQFQELIKLASMLNSNIKISGKLTVELTSK